MLPTYTEDDLQADFTVEAEPTLTYRVRFDGKPSTGKIDGQAAMEQAVFLILQTERFRHAIYSWNYGTELEPLIGDSDPDLLQIELEQAIEDALLADDRVLQVTDFSVTRGKGVWTVQFTVVTSEGDLEMETEITL